MQMRMIQDKDEFTAPMTLQAIPPQASGAGEYGCGDTVLVNQEVLDKDGCTKTGIPGQDGRASFVVCLV